MKTFRMGLGALLLASLLFILPFALRPAEAAAYTDQTNVTFTSAGVTSRYHVYAAGLTAPAGLLVQFHGDGAYEFKNPTSSYSLGGSRGIVAAARARNLITVPVLAPDNSGDITWWESGTSNADYVRDLVAHLTSQYNVRSDRIWLVGYSGGAQFITQFLLPKYPSLVAKGGGAVMFGGGGQPRVTAQPFSAAVLANFPMHWYTGAADTGSGFNALAAAQAGKTWYSQKGFSTTSEWPAGVNHDLGGTFGAVVARQLDLHPAAGPAPVITPPTAATPTSPTATPPPARPTPPVVPVSGWVTGVTPLRNGVSVRLSIPSSAWGRTTLTVYGSNGSYWYAYTSSRGQVTLGIDSELRSGRTYTYKVVNGSSQVGSGSFTTLP